MLELTEIPKNLQTDFLTETHCDVMPEIRREGANVVYPAFIREESITDAENEPEPDTAVFLLTFRSPGRTSQMNQNLSMRPMRRSASTFTAASPSKTSRCSRERSPRISTPFGWHSRKAQPKSSRRLNVSMPSRLNFGQPWMRRALSWAARVPTCRITSPQSRCWRLQQRTA